jgi:hypothetical protein
MDPGLKHAGMTNCTRHTGVYLAGIHSTSSWIPDTTTPE